MTVRVRVLQACCVRAACNEPDAICAGPSRDPGWLLKTAGELYGNRPDAVLITIGGESHELGRGLSAPVRGAVRKVVSLLWEHPDASPRTRLQ